MGPKLLNNALTNNEVDSCQEWSNDGRLTIWSVESSAQVLVDDREGVADAIDDEITTQRAPPNPIRRRKAIDS